MSESCVACIFLSTRIVFCHMQTHQSWEESTFSSQRWSGQGLQVFFVSLWLGDLSWDNVGLTKIFLPCSHPQGEFLSRPPAVLDSNGVKRLAGSSEYRREYLKHPLNGSGDQDLEKMNFSMAGFGLFGFKTNEV